ncbi:hypothetical protein FE784_14125 [Paenibacillus hemerocallicola]|uniref:Uncharacterized protein n=1 Tax=Paenibacillus hemerocallicola TaxID=1172614 RepID=A0A5C4TAU4_9BACL|nr:hypothetical protein [Paenibacillus hemerocallicola]TNJ65559.1 hypothetical protein FE784_14125 [Paenibacillus hemerocallicola]
MQEQLQKRVYDLLKYKNNNPAEKVVMNFGTMTDFTWDKMYIIGSYSSGLEANKKLGFRWSNKDGLLTTDFQNLFVFVTGQRVVQVVNYTGFLDLQGRSYFTSTNSKFEVLEQDNDRMNKLIHFLDE